MSSDENFIPYQTEIYEEAEMIQRSQNYYHWLDKRRTVREFSSRSVSEIVIENIICAASTAPSGAHKQPWTFCAVSNPEIKKKIREGAELEEKENYESRMSERWKKDLEIFNTNPSKPFLEIAPWLIVVFKRIHEIKDDEKHNNYYVTESVGLACGMLLTAIHNCGLVAVTHTPSPMNFLTKILNRPENERPFLLIPVGFPDENAKVPDLKRKPKIEILHLYR